MCSSLSIGLLFAGAALCGSTASAVGFGTDSLHTNRLNEVTVKAARMIARASMPTQILSNKEFSQLNAANVTDVAKHFAGVTVKDYGGIGGLKTVSLRGLGAQHTGVSYDGVMLSDIQSGQIDLGRFSLDNISEISLSNGQPNDLLQSARMFSSAGVLCLNSKLPEYDGKNQIHGTASIKTGSFGLVNPMFFANRTFGKKLSTNISIDGVLANGEYKFLQNYNQCSSNGITESLTRKNSDIQSIKTEFNANYKIQAKENISLKINYFESERGLPGPVIFYNIYSNERLWDKNLFTQIQYKNHISTKFQFQGNAKYNYAYNLYRDVQEEKYAQNETYLSSTILFKPNKNFCSALALDWWHNNLFKHSTNQFAQFNYPTRNTTLANISTKYVTDRWNITGSLLYTMTREHVRTGIASDDRNKFSPSASISYKIWNDKEIRIRAFYKNIFRIPTFNDLYYQDFGNTGLKPENTHQYNVGLIFAENNLSPFSELEVSTDFYYNNIEDKLIAIPKDLFHWTMTNQGKVDILGCDVTLKSKITFCKNNHLMIKGNYTFQQAEDATPGSATFGKQIIYSPRHSGAGSVSYQRGTSEIGYNMVCVSQRLSNNYPFNKLKGYMENSVFASKTIRKLKLTAEAINIFNTTYEVIQYYPMPGRNFRFTTSYTF